MKMFTEKYETDLFLNILILQILKNLLNSENIVIVDHKQKYNRLVQHQALVGWDQILKDQFVTDWSKIINDFIARLTVKLPKSFFCEVWMSGIIKLILDYA